jgi:hypothetical protein
LPIGSTKSSRDLDARSSFDGAPVLVTLSIEVPLAWSMVIVVEEIMEAEIEHFGEVLLAAFGRKGRRGAWRGLRFWREIDTWRLALLRCWCTRERGQVGHRREYNRFRYSLRGRGIRRILLFDRGRKELSLNWWNFSG